jgi:5'-nucleotidase
MLPSKVYMRDPAAVRVKLMRLAAGGLSDVFCVSDFDATMTTPEGLSSWCVLERSPFTSDGYRARTRELFNTYYPCEIDPTLTLEQKIGKMVEWWGNAEEALIGERLPEGIFARMVAAVEDRVVFRSGCQQLLRTCERAAVPFLVFSAGVANVIEEVLQTKDLMLGNMHVISNRVAFTDGVASHFSTGTPIHVFNKHVGLIAGTPFEREVSARSGVLLFGDSLGDVTMSSDDAAATVLRVGYLNTGVGKKVEDHLKRYAAAFDVVLVGDGTMSFPLQLLRAVAGEVSVDDVMALNANVDIVSAVSAGDA